MTIRHYERSYATARSVLGFLEVVGWITVALGVLAALIGFGTGGLLGAVSRDPPFSARLISAIPGVISFVGGLVSVCYVQVSRAHVDTAEMTRELLDLTRTSLKETQAHTASLSKPVSEDNLSKSAMKVAPFVSSKQYAPPENAEDRLEETYKGMEVYKRHDGHYVGEKWFANLKGAKAFIDRENDGEP